jgi:hypothetical protein
MTRSYRKYNVV